jgi:hypothetical protein
LAEYFLFPELTWKDLWETANRLCQLHHECSKIFKEIEQSGLSFQLKIKGVFFGLTADS